MRLGALLALGATPAAGQVHSCDKDCVCDGVDLSHILLPNHGYMPVVDRFPYLGDVVLCDGSDEAAVDARIESGSKAFGALRGCIFSSSAICTLPTPAATPSELLPVREARNLNREPSTGIGARNSAISSARHASN